MRSTARVRPELPPQPGIRYQAFVDASGGRHDSYTICIGHKDNAGRFICDVLRGKEPPFDPQVVTREHAALAKEYRCTKIIGDAYSADWIVSAFRESGATYQSSEKSRSDLYLEGLPSFSRFIGDRGMVTSQNLDDLRSGGHGYIVGRNPPAPPQPGQTIM